MGRRTLLRVWLPLAIVVVLAVGGTLIGLSVTGGGKSSAPEPPATATTPPSPSGGKAAAGVAVKPQHHVGVFSSHLHPLTTPMIRHLRGRVGDNETPLAPSHPVHITSTKVRGFAPRTPARHSKRVRTNVVGSAADVAVADDATVADPSSSQGTSTKEPSVASDGNTIFATGNWYAVRSRDGGQTWDDFNPINAFGSEFCCDQVVLYDPAWDRFFWLLQFEDQNGKGYLQLAVSSGASAFDNYCTYTFHADSFNLPDGDIDYNDMGFTRQNLFITSNIYLDNNGKRVARAGVLRLSLQEIANCGTEHHFSFTDPDAFSIRPVQGAGDTMYLGTNYVRSEPSGRWFRIYRWPDSSTQYTTYTRSIDAFNYETAHLGDAADGNCSSEDGAVFNWCERTDSRMASQGVIYGNRLVFAFNAAPVGDSRPLPYIRIISFDPTSMNYVGSEDLYSTTAAFQYPAIAVNSRGDIGGVFAWGGGSGSDEFFPGMGVFLFSVSNPTLNVDFYQSGNGNACVDRKNQVYRWGDYLTVRPDYPSSTLFRGTGYLFDNDCDSGGDGMDHTFVFGRRQYIG